MDSNTRYKKGMLIKYASPASTIAKYYGLDNDYGIVVGTPNLNGVLPVYWLKRGRRFDVIIEYFNDEPVFDIVAPVVE